KFSGKRDEAGAARCRSRFTFVSAFFGSMDRAGASLRPVAAPALYHVRRVLTSVIVIQTVPSATSTCTVFVSAAKNSENVACERASLRATCAAAGMCVAYQPATCAYESWLR